ncbi:MAG TPA: chromosome segregation SMC family protein [Candidatus Acidoferrum sp.]|nr:chromosome segregation SMC family protein [Candidatus Acidoferrum sp.]
MLYLDRLTIHNFKSFRHASISFGKGFNCVVGPNGSGKSNICDALLFSFGETSLKRMRVSSSKDLINKSAKPIKDDGVRRAYVTATFTGDDNLEISRAIKSNNKIAYRVNGKRVTRQELIDVLKAHKAEINDTNTIAQGEIQRVLSLGARERRGLIDIAAGISEFDDKKDIAMKELQKVETKTTESNIMLGERQSFLNELEKDKGDAERYMELASTLKRVNYTILKAKELQINDEYKKAVEGYEKATNRKKELENQITKLEDELSSATAYRENMSKKLNEGSIELATANKLIEEINSAIKLKESEISHIKEAMEKGKERIKALKEETSQIEAQKESNISALSSINGELAANEKELSTLDVGMDGSGKELIVKYSEKQKELEALESRLSNINGEYVSCNSEFSRNEEDLRTSEERLLEIEKQRAASLNELKKMQSRFEGIQEKVAKGKAGLSTYQTKLSELRSQVSDIDSELITVRESLAQSGRSTDKMLAVLKAEMKKGFYGRAGELCTYDEKYAVAVHASGANRLNYFVVDSVDVASDAIEIIKSRNLGRASFIPLKQMNARATEEKAGLEPLIGFISFDDKYRAAFEYIFSDTYLVDKVKGSKLVGKHRLVTLEGEVVEQSGIVTGGRLTLQHLPAVLEAKLTKLNADKKALALKAESLEKEWEQKRKEVAAEEMEGANLSTSIKYIQSDADKLKSELDNVSKGIAAMKSRITALNRSKEGFSSKKIEIEKEREVLKAECDNLYNALNKPTDKKHGSTKSNVERVKVLRETIEGLKVKIGQLGKENEIRDERSRSIAKEIKAEDAAIKGSKSKVSEAESAISEQEKKRIEIQESIKSKSDSSSSLFKELQASEEKIQKMGFQKGKISSDIDKIERDLIETESRRSQMQTRLSDIKAELLSYQEMEQVEFKEIDELEKQSLECKHEMELLGNVNLKAPEAYAQRKKDVDEARQKLDILEKERSSILSMIGEIESKKLGVFNETFSEVNENFKKLYGSIFDGSAHLLIDNPADPFNARLQFSIQMGSKSHSEQELSGGQKSLVMLALIFAIQMRKPMSFYIFDEIDVALDKENSKKLSKLIKELSKNSQFIVVSHNDSLITMAEAAIGVAMQEGQSRAVGIEVTNRR